MFVASLDTVLTVPFVELVDLLLRHLEEVSCTLGVQPATINAIVLTLTHHEAAGLTLVFTLALAEVFNLAVIARTRPVMILIGFQRQSVVVRLCLELVLSEGTEEYSLLLI